MTFHSFVNNVDIPKYDEGERETFLSDFQSEVNARFSGIKSNKNVKTRLFKDSKLDLKKHKPLENQFQENAIE